MAVTEEVISRNLRALLDDGTTASGAVRTVSQSLGTLGNPDTWDAQKAFNIASALVPCLVKSIYRLESVTNASIKNAS